MPAFVVVPAVSGTAALVGQNTGPAFGAAPRHPGDAARIRTGGRGGPGEGRRAWRPPFQKGAARRAASTPRVSGFVGRGELRLGTCLNVLSSLQFTILPMAGARRSVGRIVTPWRPQVANRAFASKTIGRMVTS
jgi:hypothetical protein